MKPRLVHCVNVINFTHWGTVIILAVSMTACRTVRIIGTVRDHCGIPVAGVVVRAYCDTSVFSQSCVNGRHPLESCLQGIAVTDSHGHFAVPVSTSRAGQLLVEKHGFYPDKSSYAPEGTNYYDLRMTRRLMLTAKDLIRIKSIVGDELIAELRILLTGMEWDIYTYVALGRLFRIRDHILPTIEQLAKSSHEAEVTRMDMRLICELFSQSDINTSDVLEVAVDLSDAIAQEESSLRRDMGAIDELRTLMFMSPDNREALVFFVAFTDYAFVVRCSRFCHLDEGWSLCISKVLARS